MSFLIGKTNISRIISLCHGKSRKCFIVIQEPLPSWKYNKHGSSLKQQNALSTRFYSTITDKQQSSGTPSSTALQRPRRLFRWLRIPVGLIALYMSFCTYLYVRRTKQDDQVLDYAQPNSLEVLCYKMLPLKTVSRVWGWVNSVYLPEWAREPIIGWYATSFHANLDDAEDGELKHYKNLGEFFRRSLKTDVRPVDYSNCVVSPSDGTVLTFGPVQGNQLEQVKGVNYSVDGFFGPNCWSSRCKSSGDCYQETLISESKGNQLYQCVIYLAPGDYHRFHSPVDCEIIFRRHFTGELLSVSPGMAGWISGLFNMNERAVYIGKWKYGFFSMSAVGATNVGSIKVKFDEDLTTNARRKRRGIRHDCSFLDSNGQGVFVKKGELFGEFNLGSSIVLVFEAPQEFKFTLQEKQKVKYGQAINECIPEIATASKEKNRAKVV